MGKEIERKFLVIGSAWKQHPGVRYVQGYLNRGWEHQRPIAGTRTRPSVPIVLNDDTRIEFRYKTVRLEPDALGGRQK